MTRRGKREKRRRVAIVRQMPYPAEVGVYRDVRALHEAGFDVDVIADREPGRPAIERSGGITVWRIPPGHIRGGFLRYAFRYATFPLVAALVLAFRSLQRPYHWVEINNPPDWLIFSALFPKLLGAKIAWYCREDVDRLFAMDFGVSPKHPAIRLLRAVEWVCGRLADRTFTTQELARRDLIQQGIPADRIVVVPNGPDERIAGSPVAKSARDGALQPDRDGSFRLVTHGTVVKRYGIETMVEAVAILRHQIPAITLEVLGDGEYRPELEKLADRLGIGAHVSFVGGWIPSYDEVTARLVRADVGLVGLWTNHQLPTKLLDYLSLGLPTITTESAAVRPYLDDGEVVYVEPRNAQALADAILALYRDPERRAALGDAGYAAYLEHFAWERTKHDYLAVYGSCPGSGPGKDSGRSMCSDWESVLSDNVVLASSDSCRADG